MNNDAHIFIVEDEILNMEFIISGLERYGFGNFTTAASAEEALKKLSHYTPDIILIDVTLERIYSGIYLAHEINCKYKIPVIFITGRTDNEMVKLIEKSNMFGVLFKPFQIQILKVIIKAALSNSALIKQVQRNAKRMEEKVREINAFFSIARLSTYNLSITEVIRKALKIIPMAFKYDSNMTIRITYNGKQYCSSDFKVTKWVLSEGFNKRNKDLVELYLDLPEETGKFPFTLEEIETFSSIVKQLAVILDKQTAADKLKNKIQHQNFINIVLRELLDTTEYGIEKFIKRFLIHLGENFGVHNAHMVTFSPGGEKMRRYSFHHTTEGKDVSFQRIIVDLRKCLMENDDGVFVLSPEDSGNICMKYDSLKEMVRTNNKIVIIMPMRIEGSLVAAVILEMGLENYNEYLIDSYNSIKNIFTLGIHKINREKKINMYAESIEQSPASVVITNKEGNITFVNPAFENTSGYRYAEVVGQNARILESGEQSREFYKELWTTILDGKIWRGEFHNRKKNGELYWESASISPIKEKNGTITGFIAVKVDITKKIEAEQKLLEVHKKLKDTQSSLVMEEKLASIGRLAAGVAHEINNPIGFISSNFRTIKRYFEKYSLFIRELKTRSPINNEQINAAIVKYKLDVIEQDMGDLLRESEEGFDRVINIVNSLRSFSRVDQMNNSAKYDLNSAVTTTLTVAGNQIKHSAEIKTHFQSVPYVYCNSSQTNQVLLNIIINAVQSIDISGMQGNGRIDIYTYADDDYVCCRIEDNGSGIPEDILPNIFEPFFTTKPVGEGTGLGLNISYDIIVNKHGGELSAGNNKNGGAWFLIKLPLGKGKMKNEK